MSDLDQIAEKFDAEFKALSDKADDLAERLESAKASDDAEETKAVTDQLAELDEKVNTLQSERDKRLRESEYQGMKSQVKDLQGVIDELRTPETAPAAAGEDFDQVYGDRSFYADAKAVFQGDPRARERWEKAVGVPEGKAMTEGTGSAGGYLVPDQISSELLELREQQAVLRSLFSSINVTSDTLRIASVTGGLTASWVAELGAKPSQDMTFAEISTSVFTAAGMAVASNQLLADATRSVDGLINQDLAKRLRNLEEVAFINGSGTGQPLGILGTSDVNSVTHTGGTAITLLDDIVDAIDLVHTNFYDAPNAIVMHPRTWALIVKAREATAPTTYLVGSGGSAWGRRANDPLPGYGSVPPRGELFGVPVWTTANVPTNLGVGTNESRVIVGKFDEALILDRQGITLDQSEHVYFTTNQTIFRAEERLGFTAARYPKAFTVIDGAGLAGI
jgi:HK97 family phage major capsid protein